MHKKLNKSDTSRAAKFWPQDTNAETLEAARVDSTTLWLYQDRMTPLDEWGCPTMRVNETAHRDTESIREFADITAAAAATLTAWETNAKEWQTGRQYRKIEPGEQLQVGDFVFSMGSRHADRSEIVRLTEKTAFSATNRKWPRLVDKYRWAEIGRGTRYNCDIAARMVETPEE